MRLLKPAWVTHDGQPIFSVDIHPDGSRFATGGQGDDCGTGKVIIWNLEPVREEKSEKDEKVPKLLCQMDNHLACVNCVRWSHNGKYLASGGDDNLIMIWQFTRFGGPSTVFGSGGKLVNIENWRCSSTLRGHSGDVLDLAWSAHDAWLASCSVDNTIVVWNALKLPEQIAVLRGHSGLVKGVTWDPVGKYLASQSDDKSLRVWRTLDWQQETVVTEPFTECGGTTHVLRLNWSPDGHYVVSAHAMNNSGPTAQIIEREGWRTTMDFVGHRKAITVVRFNPCILSKKIKKGSAKAQQYSCCAIGSRDRSLSIWLTALKRPLVVTHDLFSNSIMDISWTENGMELICCSWDGTVAYVDFTKEEIGTPLSKQEVITLHESVYGKSLTTTNILHPTNQVIESAALLKLQQHELERQKAGSLNHSQLTNSSLLNGQSPIKPTDKQIETKTADGRRRITPIFLAPQPDFEATIQFDTTSEHSKIVVEKQDRITHPGLNHSGSSLSTSPHSQVNSQSQPALPTAPPPDKEASHNSQPLTSGMKPPSPSPVTTSRIEVQPMTPLGGKSPDKDKESPPPDRTSDKPREDDLPRKSNLIKVRRKLDPDKPRKKFRKDKEFSRNTSIGATSIPIGHEKESVKVVYTSSDPQVAVAKIDKQLTYEIPSKSSAKEVSSIEVENNIQSGAATLHKMRYIQDGVPLWEHVFSHRIQAVSGSSQLVCAACEDQTLSVFSAGGRKLLPSMVLNSRTSFLDCKDYHVMVVTSRGSLYVWNMQILKAVINGQSVSSILSGSTKTLSKAYLTKEGVPVVVLSDSKAYAVNQDLGCWVLVSRRHDMLHQCTDHYSSRPSKEVTGPLYALQSSNQRFGDQARAIYRTSAPLQQASTISYLENQLTVCLALKSAKEYTFWLSTYVRYLSQEGLESKIREVCDDLLGPLYKHSSKSAWETNILGVPKRDLLQQLLPLIGSNLQLQRIYTEYQEQLDTVKL